MERDHIDTTQRLAFFFAALMLLAVPACHVAPFNPSAQDIRDDELAKQVKNTLLESKRLNLSRIDVSVEEATVYLTGEASSSESKFEAERLAGQVPGIKTVVNKLEVQP